MWKRANVTPVSKSGNAREVKQYRPISLPSIISKFMERCVYKHVHHFLRNNRIITQYQSGFTRGNSAINQLLSMPSSFGQALDNSKDIRVVFCDISKDFDRVWHRGLQQYGITGRLLRWFSSCMSD